MLSFINRTSKGFCVLFLLLYFNFSNAQPKKIAPELILEFANYLERNLMPVTTYLDNSKDLSTFVKTLKLAGVFETLKHSDAVTVFAPTNAAYDQLPVEVMSELFQPENIKKLQAIVTYHIINGKLKASEIIDKIDQNEGKETRFTAINGLNLKIYYEEDVLCIKDDNGYAIKVIQQDINQLNAVVYKIETVMLPQIDNNQVVSE